MIGSRFLSRTLTRTSSIRSISTTAPAKSWYNPWGRPNDLSLTTPLDVPPPPASAMPDTTSSDTSFSTADPALVTDTTSAASSVETPFTADDVISTLDPSFLDPTTILTRAQEVAEIAPYMDTCNWYTPASLAIRTLENTWEYAGCPWWQAIAGTTLAVRFAMTPLMIRSLRTNSRMAHMKPEMDVVNEQFQNNPRKNEMEEQMKHRARLQALFKKYDANPLHSFGLIFAQMPVFMGMFFGLRNMAEDNHIPSFAYQGPDLQAYMGSFGDFTNLTIPDASFLLPIYCAGSFMLMIEMGADGMDPKQGAMMKNVMRGLAVCMVPFSMQIPQGVFMYWCTNNSWSLAQTAVLKAPGIKKAMGIWDPPKQVAGAGNQDFMKQWSEAMDKLSGKSEEEMKMQRAKEEIPTAVFSTKPKQPKRQKRGGNKKR